MQDPRLAPPPPTPEIDPELAEMEAQTKPQSVMDRLLQTVLRKRDQKGTPTQGPKGGEKSVRDTRSQAGQGRQVRRAMARHGKDPDPRRSPHARMGRAKPKKSQAQLLSEHRANVRQFLMGLRLERLVVECPEMRHVLAFKTAWALSQASKESLLALPGVGAARLKKIHAYLSSKGVPLNWSPDGK